MLAALKKAQGILSLAQSERVSPEYMAKVEELYQSLFRAPAPRWMTEIQKCQFVERIDVPLNDSEWLISQFDEIRKLATESERIQQVETVLHRIDPGPGGFYNNMGTDASFRRVKSAKTAEDDPGTLVFPRSNYNRGTFPMPNAWKMQMATLYDVPLVLVYDNLDPASRYTIRVNYTGLIIGREQSRMKLVANRKYVVHDLINTEGKPIQEFPVPQEVLKDGKIEFAWTCGEGERGSPVAEVWLMKQPNTTSWRDESNHA